jgi:hypothetical protein
MPKSLFLDPVSRHRAQLGQLYLALQEVYQRFAVATGDRVTHDQDLGKVSLIIGVRDDETAVA